MTHKLHEGLPQTRGGVFTTGGYICFTKHLRGLQRLGGPTFMRAHSINIGEGVSPLVDIGWEEESFRGRGDIFPMWRTQKGRETRGDLFMWGTPP